MARLKPKTTSDGSDRWFLSFATDIISRLADSGKQQTAAKYATTLSSFRRFRREADILTDDIASPLILDYERWLRETGVCRNTISFYMRNLRAIYNRAVDSELSRQRLPFRHVYTGIDRTVKRALSADVIHRIRCLDLSLSPALDYARDLFMFSFYTRGMSFVDMAFLRKCDLRQGVLTYRRCKTGQQLFIKWEEPMQRIVDKYDTGDSPYLLPIIRDDGTDRRRQYTNCAHLINSRLKQIGERLGLDMPLTSYVARHSWASIAKSGNVPVATISEAMGHDSESTTRIYLATLDTSFIDRANSLVLSLI